MTSRDRPHAGAGPAYTRSTMEMGTLGIGRRTEQGALAEAKESVDRAIDDLALVVLEAQERERARLADELHDGPAQALSNLITQCEIIERQPAGVPIEVTLEAPAEGIEKAAHSAVPPVARESLRNIGKHSDAQRAWLHTRIEQGASGQAEWVLEVGDDGRGFDTQHLDGEARRRHFGLRFMRERSELLGARLTIDSNPGQGTVVRLAVNISGSVR